jgi:hypothetical protein
MGWCLAADCPRSVDFEDYHISAIEQILGRDLRAMDYRKTLGPAAPSQDTAAVAAFKKL